MAGVNSARSSKRASVTNSCKPKAGNASPQIRLVPAAEPASPLKALSVKELLAKAGEQYQELQDIIDHASIALAQAEARHGD